MLLWVAVILGTGAGIYYIFRRFTKIRDGSTSRPMQPSNGTNPDEDLSSEAEDAWRRKDYERLLQLLEKDSPFPVGFSIEEVVAEQSMREQLQRFVEGRERLHGFIRDGDLDSIREFIRNHKSSVYYSTDNVSALSRAIECDKREICSYLSSIRPNFRIPEMVIEESIWSQEKSHIHKLVHATRFSEDQNREEWHAIINMYLELDKFDEIRWLMKTIEHENFELTFAIKSESVTTTDAFGIPEDVFGYTEKNGRILIAGKGITTADGYKNVYRVFAHELCHLAMHFMYRNSFNPYHPHDEERKSDFSIICNEIHNDHEAMDKLIQKVYWYGKRKWESELIVRVPEILAVYGKVKANQIFSEQIPKVYEYYKEYISKDSAEFSNPKYYCPKLLNLGKISDDHLAVRRSEMCISPFVRTENYEDYLIPIKVGEKRFSLLPTSNPKLAALHVFHAFKGICPLHADRRVLAFHLEYYHVDGNNDVICDAFDESFLQKLILVLPDRKDERGKIFDDIFFSSNEEKEVIVVVSEVLWKRHPEWNVKKQMEYHWNGLSEDYQDKLFEKKIVYQGEKKSPWSVLKDVEIPRVFIPDVLWYFMSKTDVRIGKGFRSDWNERELYVERMFVRLEYKKENFRNEKSPFHYLFVTGVSEKDLQTITSMKRGLQTLESEDEIQEEKYIFLPKLENDHANLFRKLFCKIKENQNSISWVNYEDGKFLLRDSLGRRDDIKNYFVEDSFNEDQILIKSQGMNVILVADEPGAGKSTSINYLMEEMKRKYPVKLICRVNFREHLNEFSNSPSLPSLLKFLQRVFKMINPLEKMTFQAIIGVPRRVVVFFDGFDEMSKNIQHKAMKSLQLLRKETNIQMWIFTRKHERLTLEEEMNTVSFSLRQFSFEDQCKYFNQFWKSHLISLYHQKKDSDEKFQQILKNLDNYSGKCERQLKIMKELVIIRKEIEEEFLKKINESDFSDYSRLVINSVKDNILKEQFIVPLWLWMVANIIIDSNFKIPEQRDRYTFYNDFMEKKVDYHLRIKCEISSDSKYQEGDYYLKKGRIFENLRMFSVKVMQSEHYVVMSDLKKYGLKDKYLDLKKGDLEELFDVGLVRKVGEIFHFFHKTFADFFFSQMFVEEIKSGNVQSVNEKLLSDVLLEDSYREVRMFLDDFLEKDESQSFVFPKIFLQEFKLFEIYSEFCMRINDRTGDWIWKIIFQGCEMQMKKYVDENSILNVLNFYPFNGSELYLNGVLDVLNSTFTDRMLFIMFDSRVDKSCKLLFRCLQYIESNDLKAMMSIFEKIMNYKKSHLSSEVPTTGNSLGNIKVGLEIFVKEYSNDDDSFSYVKHSKINIYNLSAMSYNWIAFIKVLKFASTFMNREDISKCLQRTCVLHLMTERRKGKVLEDLIEIQIIIGNAQLRKLLRMKNDKGKSMLHILMKYSGDPRDVTAVLEFVEGVMKRELFKQFLIQKDNEGIFPISCSNLHIMKHILVFMGRYFNNQDIIDLLSENKVHLWEYIRETDCALEEILNLEEILGREWFEEVLISKDEDGNSVLHLMTERRKGKVLEDIIQIQIIIGNAKLSKLLTMKNDKGKTMLHTLMKYSEDPKYVSAVLEFFEGVMEGELFKQFLTQKDNWGIFPIFCAKHHIMKDILLFMRSHLSNEYIRNMLRENKVHLGDSIREIDCALEDILYLEECLGIELFKEILISIDKDRETRLHIMMIQSREGKLFARDLKVYKRFLDSDSMREFLYSQDNSGDTFLHNWAYFYRGSQYIDILRELHSTLSPDSFEDLLNIRNKSGRTFIYYFNSPLSELYPFLEEFLGMEKFIKLVTAKCNNGMNRLHWIYCTVHFYQFDVLCKDLKFYYELLDESSFRDFILTKDKKGRTFCFYLDYNLSDLNEIEGILSSIINSPDLFLELRKTVKLEYRSERKLLNESESESEEN